MFFFFWERESNSLSFTSFIIFPVSSCAEIIDILSYSTDWWVKEDATGEVSIAPLRKRCFLLEITLDIGKVLLL